LAERLISWGAEVSYHDPLVPQWQVSRDSGPMSLTSTGDVYDSAEVADIVVLLQPHAVYDLHELASRSSLLLDTRGKLPPSESVLRL